MMTANRKLQAEIDRVLKRVAEGVAEFEETMEKLNGAGNLAQKEKYEAELKKIIKKLQRERDQIKTWLTSNDVKDKSVLTDQRRLIETQMEKFKAIERELKTKAYSREGLSAATKMDPQEKEKAELGNWISDSVDRLSAQVDKYEAEAEQLQAAAKKKRVDTAKAEKLSQLDRQVERHKHHMSNLEVILRMLENGQLSVDDVQSIKEDVDYYIESAEGGDFPEDDAFYDDLNLDETQYGHPAEGATDSEDEDAAPSPKELEKVASGPASAVGSPQRREEKKSALATPAPAPKLPPVTAPPPPKATAPAPAKPAQPPAGLPPRQPFTAAVRAPAVVPAPPPVVSTQGRGYSAVAAATAAAVEPAVDDKKGPARPAEKGPIPPAAGPSAPTVRPSAPPPHAQPPPATQPPQLPTSTVPTIPSPPVSLPPQPQPPAPTPALAPVPAPVSAPPVPIAAPAPTQTVTSPTPSSVSQASASPQLASALPTSSASPVPPSTPSRSVPEPAKEEPPQESSENRLPPSLADLVESFEAAKARTTKGAQDAGFSKMMLESAFQFIPDGMDWEKPKNYVPKTPYPTPLYYPQSPPTFLEDPSLFEKFDVDTLFFVFYYQQGTYAQYLAARELKRQSWRFHKKYLTWFQRHEEPKAITDEYEQGTYIYFDYEGAWCQRKKSEFRFEYKFLEDQAD